MTNTIYGDNYTLYQGDCRDWLRTLPDASVDLIATDPPYYRVKDDAWDNQWATPAAFLAWLGEVADEWRRILKPNGSLYVFASPQMAWHVEGVIRERFNVLNHLVWNKDGRSRSAQSEKEALRCFFGESERIIFAEHGHSDQVADEIAGFTEAETGLKRRIFGDYLAAEWKRAGVSYHKITGAIGAHGEHNHGGAASNWALGLNVPTPDQYAAMREYLNRNYNHGGDYLRQEYEDLRQEYEDLRQEYEDLRRPFNATPDAPYTDVWTFPTVGTYPNKHPCEKPLALMEHIVNLSTRPGAVVLDCFMGGGTTGHACARIGDRHFIGVEMSNRWFRIAARRIADAARAAAGQPKQITGHVDDFDGLPLLEMTQ